MFYNIRKDESFSITLFTFLISGITQCLFMFIIIKKAKGDLFVNVVDGSEVVLLCMFYWLITWLHFGVQEERCIISLAMLLWLN